MPRGKRILALDGGGVKGLNQLLILQALQKEIGPIHEQFDLIVGTSVGAMLAGCIGLLKKSPTELIPQFEELLQGLFKPSFWPSLFFLCCSTHRPSRVAFMEEELKSEAFFGLKTLADYKDNVPKVAFIATNKTTTDPIPFIFRNYDVEPPSSTATSDFRFATNRGSSTVPIWQAIRASSAAPTYLDPIQIDQETFVDGGLMANNPVEIAMQEAHFLWPNEPVSIVTSIGCGLNSPKANGNDLLNLGGTIIDIVTDAELIQHRFHVNLNLFRSTPFYARFNPPGAGDTPLATTDQVELDAMMSLTKAYLATSECAHELERLGKAFQQDEAA